MVMLQPKLSLKPTTAFELQNIGLFAISHPLLCFSVLFQHKCRICSGGKGAIKTGRTEFIAGIVETYTVGCDMMQIQKRQKGRTQAYCLTDATNDTPSKTCAVQY